MTSTLPLDIASSKNGFIRRAHKYVLIKDVLFMKGAGMILRRVPWKEEVYRILEANHEGACGGHFALPCIKNCRKDMYGLHPKGC